MNKHHHQHRYNHHSSGSVRNFHTCCFRADSEVSNGNVEKPISTTTSENNNLKLSDDENTDTNNLNHSAPNPIQVLRDPSLSSNLKDFILDTVTIVQRKHQPSKHDDKINPSKSNPNLGEARHQLESVRDRLREKFGNTNLQGHTTTKNNQGLSNSIDPENFLEETILKNVQFMQAIKKYDEEVAKNDEKLPLYGPKYTFEKFLQKQFKPRRRLALSTILSYFVKYPEITRSSQFYTKFLEVIAMKLRFSKKMSLETIDKIFEKIPPVDVSPATYRALILCYANKGKMDAIPALLDKMDSLLEKGFFRATKVPLKLAKETYYNGQLPKPQTTTESADGEEGNELLQELFQLEMLKLKITFEAFAHNKDFSALEKLIKMKRPEWLSNYRCVSTYIRMVNDALEFYLINNDLLHAKQLVDLFYRYDLPRSNGREQQFQLNLSPEGVVGNPTLLMKEKPTRIDEYGRFFNLQLWLYKELAESKLNDKFQENPDSGMKNRELMPAQKLFDMTIAEMKKEGIIFTREIYQTICTYNYRQQAYERCVFFFEDALRHGIIPGKRSFIYAEESYLMLNDIKKAMQCHQLRDVYCRLGEVSNDVSVQGAAACLDFLYNYKDKKTIQGQVRKRIEEKLRQQKEEKLEVDGTIEKPILKAEPKPKPKDRYTLTELFLRLTKKQ
ncbi:hypothetical protein FDP41_004280 [Naegleria fowleri]|uniref:Uncharacterized protein n=1 Tax=Naegleria fowleri TaxID=5763 RepID=A0A6A5BUH8_NAEFO|nr:uncharacterized protein FDP41_004280 [Naegleria fowleri]KAF0976985.1 hypothetical protein FDP41_004280 [Naegleria fowleri]CAG4716739.1 unnamed protein product [Naegleria fowleri]